MSLRAACPKRDWEKLTASSLGPLVGTGSDAISAAALYPRWAKFLKPDDILIAETGDGIHGSRLCPAASRRDVPQSDALGLDRLGNARRLRCRGGGSRQACRAGDGRWSAPADRSGDKPVRTLGLRPIVFVLNNDGYLIERLLCKEPAIAYNDIAPWHYADLPHAFGCDDWMTARVVTCEEFDQSLDAAATSSTGV